MKVVNIEVINIGVRSGLSTLLEFYNRIVFKLVSIFVTLLAIVLEPVQGDLLKPTATEGSCVG